MSEAWRVVLFAGLASMALKSAGPVAIGGRPLPQRVMGVVGALAPALLAALVATQTVTTGRDLVLDERALGVAAAAVLV
ncbi:MAG: AzlD domain-containing protein, partial [Dehalococcoidia bacterium]|nr:AzlD domain-containing protein [Dehalococcoidia bacterium]